MQLIRALIRLVGVTLIFILGALDNIIFRQQEVCGFQLQVTPLKVNKEKIAYISSLDSLYEGPEAEEPNDGGDNSQEQNLDN